MKDGHVGEEGEAVDAVGAGRKVEAEDAHDAVVEDGDEEKEAFWF